MSNVTSIFSARPERAEDLLRKKLDETWSFADMMRRNAENEERLRKERAKANGNIVRNYRMKETRKR